MRIHRPRSTERRSQRWKDIKDSRTLERNSPEAVVGRVEQMAEAFVAWREEGVDEVMCRMDQPSAGTVEMVADAAQMFRASVTIP